MDLWKHCCKVAGHAAVCQGPGARGPNPRQQNIQSITKHYKTKFKTKQNDLQQGVSGFHCTKLATLASNNGEAEAFAPRINST